MVNEKYREKINNTISIPNLNEYQNSNNHITKALIKFEFFQGLEEKFDTAKKLFYMEHEEELFDLMYCYHNDRIKTSISPNGFMNSIKKSTEITAEILVSPDMKYFNSNKFNEYSKNRLYQEELKKLEIENAKYEKDKKFMNS